MQTLVITLASPQPNYWVVRISPESGAGIAVEIPCHDLDAAKHLAHTLGVDSPCFYPWKG